MAGREGRLWTAAAATAGPSAPGQVALQMPAEAAGAPPPQQHQDAPREQGVLNALASRFHPRALRTFLSGGRQRQPQVGMGVSGPSLYEQHMHNQQQQPRRGYAEQQQPLGGGGLVGMVAQQGRMQAEGESAENRASERRRQRQRPREQAHLRSPQSGWTTSQPMPLMESPQPVQHLPNQSSPRTLPQLQHQQHQGASRQASSPPSSSLHRGGTAGTEGGGTKEDEDLHRGGASGAEGDEDTEGTAPPADPEAGALPCFTPKPPHSPPGNVASSSSSDADAPSGPREAPSIPRNFEDAVPSLRGSSHRAS